MNTWFPTSLNIFYFSLMQQIKAATELYRLCQQKMTFSFDVKKGLQCSSFQTGLKEDKLKNRNWRAVSAISKQLSDSGWKTMKRELERRRNEVSIVWCYCRLFNFTYVRNINMLSHHKWESCKCLILTLQILSQRNCLKTKIIWNLQL